MEQQPNQPVTPTPEPQPDAGAGLGSMARKGLDYAKDLPNKIPGGWGTLGGMGAGALLGYLLRRNREGGLGAALTGAGLGGLGGYAAQQMPWQRWLGEQQTESDPRNPQR